MINSIFSYFVMLYGAFSIRNDLITVWKVSKYRVFSGPYFPVFGLSVNLRIQSECRKIRTRKNSVLEHFLLSEFAKKNALSKVDGIVSKSKIILRETPGKKTLKKREKTLITQESWRNLSNLGDSQRHQESLEVWIL